MSIEFKLFFGPNGGGGLTCQKATKQVVDDASAKRSFEVASLGMARHRRQLALAPSAGMQLSEIRLPKNEIGDRAVRALVQSLVSGGVRLGVLELYKNRLGDASAQALGVLVEETPAPGIHALHLSHNYFSPTGVGLILRGAVRSNKYPSDRPMPNGLKTSKAPLWLRVEQQRIPWKMLAGKTPSEQLQIARMLLTEKERSLATQVEQEIVPGRHQLLCMPEPAHNWQEFFANEADALAYMEGCALDDRAVCNSYRCRHITRAGPVVHLPYFWSQRGASAKLPRQASLKVEDKGWHSWRPKFNHSLVTKRNRDGVLAIEADAESELAIQAAAEAAEQAAMSQFAIAPEAAPQEASGAESDQSDDSSSNSETSSPTGSEQEAPQEAGEEGEAGLGDGKAAGAKRGAEFAAAEAAAAVAAFAACRSSTMAHAQSAASESPGTQELHCTPAPEPAQSADDDSLGLSESQRAPASASAQSAEEDSLGLEESERTPVGDSFELSESQGAAATAPTQSAAGNSFGFEVSQDGEQEAFDGVVLPFSKRLKRDTQGLRSGRIDLE